MPDNESADVLTDGGQTFAFLVHVVRVPQSRTEVEQSVLRTPWSTATGERIDFVPFGGHFGAVRRPAGGEASEAGWADAVAMVTVNEIDGATVVAVQAPSTHDRDGGIGAFGPVAEAWAVSALGDGGLTGSVLIHNAQIARPAAEVEEAVTHTSGAPGAVVVTPNPRGAMVTITAPGSDRPWCGIAGFGGQADYWTEQLCTTIHDIARIKRLQAARVAGRRLATPGEA